MVMLRPRRMNTPGFTLIEILIVIAIVGLLLLIIFLIVPSAQRNLRNNNRRQMVGYVSAQLGEYASFNGSAYPDTPAQFCDFISSYLKERVPNMQTCNPVLNGSKQCVLVTSSTFNICYHDRIASSHAYLGPYDEISIQGSHVCNDNPAYGEPAGHPIASTSDADDNVRQYVVWTVLENAGVYCKNN